MLKVSYSIADQNFETTKSLGILNLSVNLLEALAASHQFENLTVFSNSTIKCKISSDTCQILKFNSPIKNKIRRLLWDQWGVYRAATLTGNDWLFLPKGFASFVRKPPCRLAAYVHDTMQKHYEVAYPGQMSAFETWYFRRALQATIKYADVIFTNSDFTRNELRRLSESYGFRLPRTEVAGIGFSDVSRSLVVKKEQIMVLASKWPHKLTPLAIEFINRWQERVKFGGNVVWIGHLPNHCSLPPHSNWQHYLRLGEKDFQKILDESRVMVYFSNYEGFGMPPVEAIISQTCPVFSDLPVTREVMHGSGFSFENENFESFASAMSKALASPQELLVDWKEKLLDAHRWEKVVSTVVNTLGGGVPTGR